MRSYKELMHYFIHKYEENIDDVIGKNYISWSKLNEENKANLTKVLSVNNVVEGQESYNLGNYWASDFPIDFNVYPNSRCDIFTDEKSGNYYMVYLEFGGHKPEERCRLIQKKLLRFSTFKE